VVGADENRQARSGGEFAVVTEDEIGAASDQAAGLQDVEIRVEGDFAESDHDPKVWEQVELALEEGTAIAEFVRGGLVSRGSAAGGGGDERVL
jgi:hypothetical protein